MGCTRTLIGKIAAHGRKGDKDFVHIPTVVARILLLLGHDTDHQKRHVVQVNIFTEWIAPLGKELLSGVSAEECNPTAGALIVPVIEAALANVEATNISEL